MSGETHTPGPWFARSDDDGKSWSVISASMTTKSTICYIYGNRSAAVKPIDARLIAAAPDMLAALKLALPCVIGIEERHGDGPSPVRLAVEVAIAKADGRT